MVLMLPIFVAARSIQNISKYAMNLNTITVIRGGSSFFRPTLKMSQIMCCVVSGFRTLFWFSDAFSEAVNMFVCTIARRVPFLRHRSIAGVHTKFILNEHIMPSETKAAQRLLRTRMTHQNIEFNTMTGIPINMRSFKNFLRLLS